MFDIFGLSLAELSGPGSAVIVAIIMAKTFKDMFMKLLKRDDARFERMITTFEAEVMACERRYQTLLTEVLKLKEDRR